MTSNKDTRPRLPLGVKVKVHLDLTHYLPYRIHKLWATISSPKVVSLQNGKPIRTREWRVLLILATYGPKTNAEITNLVMMDAATTTRSIKSLLAAGLVTLRPHSSDRRKQVITLTSEGALVHDEIAQKRIEFTNDLVAKLTKHEQREFVRLMDKLDERISEITSEDPDPFTEEY